jgi:hypothetical protein
MQTRIKPFQLLKSLRRRCVLRWHRTYAVDVGTIGSRRSWCQQDTSTERMRARRVKKKHGIIIETPTEARQAEGGPSILLLLSVSLIFVVLGMAVVWYVFFRT